MYDIKGLYKRRKFLSELRNRVKSKRVLHESQVFTGEEQLHSDDAKSMILSEDLDTTAELLQKVVIKLQGLNRDVDFSEDNSAKLVDSINNEEPLTTLSPKKLFSNSNCNEGEQENNSQNNESEEEKFSFFSFLKCKEVSLPSDDEIDNFLSVQRNAHSLSPDHYDPFADSDNSKDSDYIPSITADDSDSDNYQKVKEKKIVIQDNILIHPPVIKNKTAQNKYLNNYEKIEQHCEYSQCSEEVFSSCGKCLCLLCWNHFDDEKTYNDCFNHITKKSLKNTFIVMKKPFIIQANTNKKNTEKKTKQNQKDIEETKVMIKKQNVIDDRKQHCEHIGCEKDICSTCDICSCFLCVDHFVCFSSGSNCDQHKPKIQKENTNPNKKKENSSQKNKKDTTNKDKTEKPKQTEDKDEKQHCEHIGCDKDICATCYICSCLLCVDHFTCLGLNQNCDEHKPYITEKVGEGPVLTKSGTLRKRKLYCEDLAKRKEKKALLNKEKLYMRAPCLSFCKKQCSSNFDNNMREYIHKTYHNLNWEAQGLFIKSLVVVKPVARRKQNTTPKRDFTYNYNFLDMEQKKIEVCKTFFLSTLGYDPKNDKRVFLAIKKSADNQKNLKGSYERSNKIDREVIKQHVMKYEPSISHYRRQHAPYRLYLPSDLNITIMYKNFCDSHSNLKISLETYRKIVTCELNISFTKLGHEECELCAYFQLHSKDHVQNRVTDCEICCNYEKHKDQYICSRVEYQKDVQKSKTSDTDTIFYSVDLQKVVMLPRMEQYKTAIFCPRIVVYNETFVPLGSSSPDNLPHAVVWPESIAGRNAEDIISAFRAFFLQKRDKKHVVLWMDNCSSQNKNWAIFSFLVEFVNSTLIAAETITFKYLEPGHTFMSADSYHHQVELSLNRKKKVYDLSDFLECVQQANSGQSFVTEMKVCDFYGYSDVSSQPKLRKRTPRCYMKDIVSVKAERGNYNLKFKINHNDSSNEETLDFLLNKIIKTQKFPEKLAKTSARGVATTRKEQILKKLVPLMPLNRRQFWYNLPESEIEEEAS